MEANGVDSLQPAAEAIWGQLVDANARTWKADAAAGQLRANSVAPKVLHAALLHALVAARERADLSSLPLLTESMLHRQETAPMVVRYLVPTVEHPREAAIADLVRLWHAQPRDPNTDRAAMHAVATLFLDVLERRLRQVPHFTAFLAMGDVAALQQHASALSHQAPVLSQEIRESRQKLTALAALRDAATPREIPTPGAICSIRLADAPPSAGTPGFLSRTPLLFRETEGWVVYTGSRDGTIHALSLLGGEPLWRLALPDAYQVPEAFASWREFLVVAPQTKEYLSGNKDLLLVDRRRGAIARRVPLPVNQMGAPAVDADVAYVMGSDGALYAVDLSSSRVSWWLNLDVVLSPFPPALCGSRLVLPANDANLRCIDLHQRREVWRFSAAGDLPHFMPAPLVDEETGSVYASNWSGALYAIELKTGKERWRYGAERTVDHAPVLADDIILIGSFDHRVHALDKHDGRVRWVGPDLGRRIYSRPLVVGHGEDAVVYTAAFQRRLHALHLYSGRVLWPEAVDLVDPAQSDFVAASGQLVIGGRHGVLQLAAVSMPEEVGYEAALAQGDWPRAVQRLVQIGHFGEAADLLAARQLFFRAGHLYERARRWSDAACAYAQDSYAADSWRRAARLYLQEGCFAAAAELLERLEDWSAAAQAWEEAKAWTKAAAIYVDRLNESAHAAQLFELAGEPTRAAALYAEQGDYSRAIRVLKHADPTLYESELQRLTFQAVSRGHKEYLPAAVERETDPRKRASLYAAAGEYTQAAHELIQATLWQEAADLLLDHGRIDRAIDVLAQRPEAPAQSRAALLLMQEQRWAEALDILKRQGDLVRQAECLRQLQRWEQAARLYEQAAEAAEVPRPDAAARGQLADWYDQAASLYAQAWRESSAMACKRKARYHGGRPWLGVAFQPTRTPVTGGSSVVQVTITNDSSGPARDVRVELFHEAGEVRFTGFPPIRGIAPLDTSRPIPVELRADSSGQKIVQVYLHWTDPDGVRKRVRLSSEWILEIGPTDLPGGGPTHVIVTGDYYHGCEVIEGNQYMNSYHQEGPRAEVHKYRAASLPIGVACLRCGGANPSSARFCDHCGADLRPTT